MMDEAAPTAWQEDAAHILASLPNPVFLLDGDDRFIFLNHAAEMFFDSSEAMLKGTALNAQIPADSAFLRFLRARANRWRQLPTRDRSGRSAHWIEASQRPDRAIWRPPDA